MRQFCQQFENSKTQGVALLVGAWIVAVLIGGFFQIRYSLAATSSPTVANYWPATTSFEMHGETKQLVIFLHPKCACSVSSAQELAKFQRRTQRLVPIKAVFYCPEGYDQSWLQGSLWSTFEAIDGCVQRVDVGAVETRKFGVETSGHVLLFDEEGRRIFSGGVTSSRGHVGANLGINSLVALIEGEAVSTRKLPVFGCKIFDDGSSLDE